MAGVRGTFEPAAALLGVICAIVFSLQLVQAEQNSTLLSVVDYSPGHVSISGDVVTIRIDQQSGSRIHSVNRYAYGVFTAWIKCPQGDTTGLVPTFYTSSLEGSEDKDEVDFEFLGKNSSVVQTNYFFNGTGKHESVHELGFDCSEAFHNYTIYWTSSSIEWFIDGQLVRNLSNTNSSAYPTKPAYVYASIWDSGSAGGEWNGYATYANSPYFYQLANVSVSSSPGTASSPARSPAYSPSRSPVGTPLGSQVKDSRHGRKLLR